VTQEKGVSQARLGYAADLANYSEEVVVLAALSLLQQDVGKLPSLIADSKNLLPQMKVGTRAQLEAEVARVVALHQRVLGEVGERLAGRGGHV